MESIAERTVDCRAQQPVAADALPAVSTENVTAFGVSRGDNGAKDKVVRSIVVGMEQLVAMKNLRELDRGEDFDALVGSVRLIGQMQPIGVRALPDGKYGVAFGQRRFAALQEAGIPTALCVVVEDDVDATTLEAMQFSENHFRKALNPIEQAKCLKAILDGMKSRGELAKRCQADKGQTAVANRLGVTQPFVSRRLSLLLLAPDEQAAVASGTLTVKEAEARASALSNASVRKAVDAPPPHAAGPEAVVAPKDEEKHLIDARYRGFHDRRGNVFIVVNPNGDPPTLSALLKAARQWVAKLEAYAKSLHAE